MTKLTVAPLNTTLDLSRPVSYLQLISFYLKKMFLTYSVEKLSPIVKMLFKLVG